ncbi:sigma factor-like helix-turn-helix DNA-binding protein [Sulfobacillus thermosulfidooxidans]|uniref:sigma factor-like helix-turn-helix DNA-binding protein n=1 Tax=Sulfobacillus thermosulfidooxidans TaxID=28034 RepID=UPI0006B69A44|nr:sigma factor-like helix-turn-helix DNA-binding protein [Sulfobacillus thermosulfidooxidans]
MSHTVKYSLYAALQTLPPDILPVISLAYGLVDGRPYSIRRIAHTLNLSERRARQLLEQGLRHLQADPVLHDWHRIDKARRLLHQSA